MERRRGGGGRQSHEEVKETKDDCKSCAIQTRKYVSGLQKCKSSTWICRCFACQQVTGDPERLVSMQMQQHVKLWLLFSRSDFRFTNCCKYRHFCFFPPWRETCQIKGEHLPILYSLNLIFPPTCLKSGQRLSHTMTDKQVTDFTSYSGSRVPDTSCACVQAEAEVAALIAHQKLLEDKIPLKNRKNS